MAIRINLYLNERQSWDASRADGWGEVSDKKEDRKNKRKKRNGRARVEKRRRRERKRNGNRKGRLRGIKGALVAESRIVLADALHGTPRPRAQTQLCKGLSEMCFFSFEKRCYATWIALWPYPAIANANADANAKANGLSLMPTRTDRFAPALAMNFSSRLQSSFSSQLSFFPSFALEQCLLILYTSDRSFSFSFSFSFFFFCLCVAAPIRPRLPILLLKNWFGTFYAHLVL